MTKKHITGIFSSMSLKQDQNFESFPEQSVKHQEEEEEKTPPIKIPVSSISTTESSTSDKRLWKLEYCLENESDFV
jgi:hypothetical protein